jgi:DNA-binding GntR family transcriptional regulator
MDRRRAAVISPAGRGSRRSGAREISQTQRATALLREMIITNRLPAGSMHLEAEIAALFGMSRTPVREAAIVLAGQGLVEVRPRRGIRVLPVSAEDMEEIYSILTELESLAAWQVATADTKRSDLEELRGLIDAMDGALEAQDRPAWAEADAEFHRRLVTLAGNRRLEAVVATFNDQVHRARMITLFLRPAPHRSNADHRRLVDALAAGDAEGARRIHRAHRMETKALMMDLIRKLGIGSV